MFILSQMVQNICNKPLMMYIVLWMDLLNRLKFVCMEVQMFAQKCEHFSLQYL